MIRPFKPDDALMLSSIIKENLLESSYDQDIIEKFIEKYAEENLVKKAQIADIYVIEENKKVIGMGLIEGNYINAMYIQKEKQKQGFGTEILHFLEAKIQEQNFDFIKLHATIDAKEFYEKNEYALDHIVHGRKNGKTYFMIKSISQSI